MTKTLRYLSLKIHSIKASLELQKIINEKKLLREDQFQRNLWKQSLVDPTSYYLDCVRFFFHGLDKELRDHRFYFSSHNRGFGEDAFHVLWWMLFNEIRPRNFLEIGVYRGQTLTLASLLHKKFKISGSVCGISPFLPAGDAVSRYRSDVSYQDDTLANFSYFRLPEPELIKAFSTDAEAHAKIRSQAWDVIYIDGNHDYKVAKSDWEICSQNLNLAGIIVLDDSSLDTDYIPPLFATAGHPGPSQIAKEVDSTKFKEILRVGHNRVFQRVE